jgi:transcriptional regulator with XRE-family HTH domain
MGGSFVTRGKAFTPPPVPTIVSIEELGRRIHALRIAQHMSLKQVQRGSGISSQHLSEIERGQTSPTIGSLIRIARALGRDTSYFLEPDERSDPALWRREEAKARPHASGVAIESLSPGIPASAVHPYRLIFEPDLKAVLEIPAQPFPGESIYYVSQGALDVQIGGERVALTEGDALQASDGERHHLQARGAAQAEVLAILMHAIEETAGQTSASQTRRRRPRGART